MSVKPTVDAALKRLRLDEDLGADVASAIEEAHAMAITYLDGPLFATASEAEASGDPRAIVCTPDIITAQLLFVDSICAPGTVNDQEKKRNAGYSILRPHRHLGA